MLIFLVFFFRIIFRCECYHKILARRDSPQKNEWKMKRGGKEGGGMKKERTGRCRRRRGDDDGNLGDIVTRGEAWGSRTSAARHTT
jgi:hypothetical protein